MKIIDKKVIAQHKNSRVVRLEVESGLIAKMVKPGQFVILMVEEFGERFPLTVVDKNIEKGTISLIIQEIGLTTKLLGELNPGDSFYALAGPLGQVTKIKNYGKVILVGGGVGIAEIYPVAKALKQAGNTITTIIGAKTKDLLILEDELRAVSDDFYATTDDGSSGQKGFVTDILKELLNYNLKLKTCNLAYAVGPIPMMKAVSLVTKPRKIKTLVSLNALMVDATGMCGSCRVTVDGKVKFSCLDGPEFNAHLVNWDELEKRNRIYEDKEKHICNLRKL
jgi:ferredoxin--NADP+ reductase